MTASAERLAAALAGRYRIERELGQGGMATVYLAHDLRHDRKVALKVLKPELAAVLGAERFVVEIKTTAALQHPHILPLLDSGEADGLLYYVMPLVTGETLRARLEREHQLPIAETVRVAREVADALGYAHGLGLIHRDIKPENILLQGGHALVADFGIALAVQSAGGERMTQTGLSLGTPQYMSPEQAVGERAIDPRSDVYALGAVTYEMLTGDPPFTGSGVQAIVAKIMSEKPTPVHRLRDTVPVHIENAVLTALAKLPADRFATAAEFASALGDASISRPTPAVTERKSLRVGGRALIAVAALAALGGSLLTWAATRGREADPRAAVVRKLEVARIIAARAGPVISPDGRWVAYPHQGRMWLRPLAALEERPVPDSDGGTVGIWSPDSRWIAYSSGGRLLKVPVEGGRPQIVATLPHNVDDLAFGGGWGPDGRIVFTTGFSGLLAVPASGGEVTTLLAPAPEESDYHNAHLLPDGRGVIFSIHLRDRPEMPLGVFRDGRKEILDGLPGPALSHPYYDRSGHLLFCRSPADAGVWAVPFSTDDLRPTGEAFLVAAGADWPSSDDHGTLLYQERLPQRSELVWVDRTGRVLESLGDPMTWMTMPALSPDGRQVAFVATDGQGTDVWLRNLERGTIHRLTFTPDVEGFPHWSAAGDRLAFHTEGAEPMLHVLDVQRGGSPVRIGAGGYPTWRADGGLVYELFGAHGIWTLPPGFATQSASPVEVLDYPTDESRADLSPDGRFMVLTADPSGKPEVYLTRFPSGDGRWQVSRGALDVPPIWSPRGDEIFYIDDQGTLVAVPVRTAPEVVLGSPIPLFAPWDIVAYYWSFDVDHAGRRFLMTRPVSGDGGAARLVHVQGWLHELRAGR